MRDKIAKSRAVEVKRAHLKWANIPLRYWNAGVEFLTPKTSAQLKQVLLNLDSLVNSGSGFWLYGKYETGKTSLAVIIAKEVIRHGGVVTFIPVMRLMDYLVKDTRVEGSEETILEHAERSNFVVLDDLGSENFTSSPTGEACLENLLRRCYDNLISVAVTTNLNGPDIVKRYHGGVRTMLSRLVKSNEFSLDTKIQIPTVSG